MAVKQVDHPDDPALRTRDTDSDKSQRFSVDQKLRRFGFRIHSRPAGKEPTWERDGKLYTEVEAFAVVTREIKKLETGR
jgi:hypothetical protein